MDIINLLNKVRCGKQGKTFSFVDDNGNKFYIKYEDKKFLVREDKGNWHDDANWNINRPIFDVQEAQDYTLSFDDILKEEGVYQSDFYYDDCTIKISECSVGGMNIEMKIGRTVVPLDTKTMNSKFKKIS